MRFFICLLLAMPVYAQAPTFTPQELLTGLDHTPFVCEDGKDVCTIKRSDAEWIAARDALLVRVIESADKILTSCRGGHAT
jgi:hypothetical protein